MELKEAFALLGLVVLAAVCAIALLVVQRRERRQAESPGGHERHSADELPARPAAAAPRPVPPSTPRTRTLVSAAALGSAFDSVRWLVGCGGVLLVVAPMLPWARVFLLGDLNLFDLGAQTSYGALWGLGLVALGVAAVGLALSPTRSRAPHDNALVVGGIAFGLTTYVWIGLANEIDDAQGFARLGVGPLLAVVGSIAIVGATWQARRIARANAESPTAKAEPPNSP